MIDLLPPWLARAIRELGVKETPGPGVTGRITEYHACTTLKATDDAVPWCSSFACWCMEGGELGRAIRSPRSARARDWLAWGVEVPKDRPRLGDVMVFSRGPNPAFGHVGFYLDEFGGMIDLISGNTGNRVCIQKFGRPGLLGVRRPAP
jgi:uncharacterized protein (TIGR02594 family)